MDDVILKMEWRTGSEARFQRSTQKSPPRLVGEIQHSNCSRQYFFISSEKRESEYTEFDESRRAVGMSNQVHACVIEPKASTEGGTGKRTRNSAWLECGLALELPHTGQEICKECTLALINKSKICI